MHIVSYTHRLFIDYYYGTIPGMPGVIVYSRFQSTHAGIIPACTCTPVSYTHLDVYKRQVFT